MRARCFAALLLLGCGTASADPPSRPAPTAPDARPAGARPRVRFALAEHFERATLARGATEIVDLGTPGGASITAGGWLSNIGPDREIDGASAALTVRPRARLAIAPRAEDGTLALRLRSFRPGTVRLYLVGAEVARRELEPARWTVVEAPLPAAATERELIVRFDRGAAVEGVRRAYLALDWLATGDDREVPDARPRADSAEGVPRLTLPGGWSATYPFEVMQGARLRGVVEGRLEVFVRAGGARARIASRAAEGPARLDVDLGPFAGELVWLELVAPTDTAVLHGPAIVTDDGAAPVATRPPRHVLVYLIDTLRADRLRAYDPQTRVHAPGLARFARGAGVFLGARAQENWTKPSVATLMSSLLPWEHTAFSDASRVPASVRLMPELLQERGFVTAGFVANGYVSGRFGFRRGWDQWRNYIREGRSTRGESLAADVLAWLDDRPADRPFFLYVHAIDPHVPYRPPEEHVARYDPDPYRGPVDFSRDAALLERIKTGALRLGARDRRRLEALYDGEVSYQDTHLTAILDGLARRGLADDTMVIVTADHGEELFDHGSVGHGHSLYDELVRVPLLVRLPGTPARRIEGSAGLVDVLPTVLEALGHEVPEALSGRSLLPRMRGDGEGAPPATVAGFMESWRSVTVGRFKLIARSRGRYRLYDLAADPGEQRDLSSERPDVVAALRGLLGTELARSRSAPRARPVPAHRPSEAAIDAELEAQLRALGYVGTSRRR